MRRRVKAPPELVEGYSMSADQLQALAADEWHLWGDLLGQGVTATETLLRGELLQGFHSRLVEAVRDGRLSPPTVVRADYHELTLKLEGRGESAYLDVLLL